MSGNTTTTLAIAGRNAATSFDGPSSTLLYLLALHIHTSAPTCHLLSGHRSFGSITTRPTPPISTVGPSRLSILTAKTRDRDQAALGLVTDLVLEGSLSPVCPSTLSPLHHHQQYLFICFFNWGESPSPLSPVQGYLSSVFSFVEKSRAR